VRILINTINYHPELTGVGKYSGEMAEWLSKKGHDVRVITAPPYYPEWSIGKGYSSFRYRKEIINGVRVLRCPLYVPLKLSGLKRIIHLASFAISSLPVLISQMFWRPNVIMTIEPPLLSAPFVWLISRISKTKCWLHIQDFEIDAAFDLGILNSKWLRSFVLYIERWLMRNFDIVSTISNQMIDKLNKKGVLQSKQVLFPNWVDNDQIFPLQSASPFRHELDIKDTTKVFLYSGNIGEKQGLESIIEAARSIAANDNILFVMCGSGSALSRLKKSAYGLNNVMWLPLQPVERLNDLLSLADVHLLPQRPDAADLVMPSKLTGMLASGKPILATVDKGTQIATVLENTGVIVPPSNVDRLVHGVIDLSNNDDLRAELGKNARLYAIENLSIDVILERFNQALHEMNKN